MQLEKFQKIRDMRSILSTFLLAYLMVGNSYAQKVIETNKALGPVISNIQGSLPSLAKARRLYYEGRNASAEQMYLTLIESGKMEQSDYLRFAHTLFQNSKPSLAKEIYNEYKRITGTGNESFERMLAQVEQAGLPIPADKLTLFVSDQPTSNLNQNKALCLIERQLFSYYKVNGTMVEMESQDNHKMDGILLHSYTLIGSDLMVFSGMEEDTYELYLAKLKHGVWKKPKKLDLGISGHKIYPSFHAEEGILHFSAKVTKEQGFDIYSSYFNQDEKSFATASNAGSEVNTAKDEICPVFKDKLLYFASDGWPGFGGFDIYKYSYSKGVLDHVSLVNSLLDELAYLKIDNRKYIFQSAPDGASLEYVLKPTQFPNAKTPEQTNPSPPQVIENETSKAEVTKNIESVRTNQQQTATPVTNPLSGLSGKVINSTYKPMDGVHLLIFNGQSEGVFALTDKNGKFNVTDAGQITFPAMVKLFVGGEVSAEYNIRKPHDNTFMVETSKAVEKQQPKTAVSSEQAETKQDTQAPKSTSTTSSKPPVSKPDASDVGRYFVVIASVTNYDLAYDYYLKWVKEFPNLEIKRYSPTRYRVLTYAGDNRADAMELYKNSKEIKGDVWLLTP